VTTIRELEHLPAQIKQTVLSISDKLPIAANASRVALVHYSSNDARTNVWQSLASAGGGDVHATNRQFVRAIEALDYARISDDEVDLARCGSSIKFTHLLVYSGLALARQEIQMHTFGREWSPKVVIVIGRGE
jgi:hypothetical protein